jgi:hypothetical protein
MTRIKFTEKTHDFFPCPGALRGRARRMLRRVTVLRHGTVGVCAAGSLPRDGLVIARRASYCARGKDTSWAAFC